MYNAWRACFALSEMNTVTWPKPKFGCERARYMNSLERAYEERLKKRYLSGEILYYEFEALKLRIGPVGQRCWYTPDFFVVTPDSYQLHEVKGFMRDDARAKLLAGARVLPMFEFYLATRKGKRQPWKVHKIA